MNSIDPLTWLSLDFWRDITQGTMKWAVEAIPKVLVILLLAFVLLRILDFIGKRIAEQMQQSATEDLSVTASERDKRAKTLIGIVRKSGHIAIWSLVSVLLLMQIGVDVAPLIAGAGVLGLAIGFGAQELVRDLITGFFMLLENQIRKGDVATINGVGGLVESMGLRTVRLRDLSGVVHIFQNGKISSLSNQTKDWSAMVFDIGVAYKENTDAVVQAIEGVAAELREDEIHGRDILEELEVFGVDAFADSAVVIKARLKTRPGQQWSVGREFKRRLKLAFDEQNIEFPFPHRTLTWSGDSSPFPVQSRTIDQANAA